MRKFHLECRPSDGHESLFRAALHLSDYGWDLSRCAAWTLLAETFFNSDISSWQTPALVNLTMICGECRLTEFVLVERQPCELFRCIFKASSFNFANALRASWGEHFGIRNSFAGCSEDVTCSTCRRRDTLALRCPAARHRLHGMRAQNARTAPTMVSNAANLLSLSMLTSTKEFLNGSRTRLLRRPSMVQLQAGTFQGSPISNSFSVIT